MPILDMKFKGKEIKISYVKFKQKQTGTDRNYSVTKKFIYQIENSEVRDRQGQTGIDRNRKE